VKRAGLALAAVAAACAVVASPAAATNECKGLMVCVPIAGPWVLAAPGQVQFQLTCPKNFIVGGLDAELSSRGIDIGFVGSLGSPVNPGVTTSKEAVFLGRLVRGRDAAPAFRPHIGCVPAQGGGARVPTAYHAFAPGKPSTRRVTQVVVGAGGRRILHRHCARGERLVAATHAVAFATPPTAAEARSVHVVQRISGGVVTLHVASATRTLVQLDLVCGAR
jgi:hypothetical protein